MRELAKAEVLLSAEPCGEKRDEIEIRSIVLRRMLLAIPYNCAACTQAPSLCSGTGGQRASLESSSGTAPGWRPSALASFANWLRQFANNRAARELAHILVIGRTSSRTGLRTGLSFVG
jgi:hypothetical protein